MAPIKLDDNIREKLEAREIKPSTEAWKKLEAKLDSAQPKKKNYVFYYVAASFVGLLILASVYFSRNTSEVNNQIVEENIQQNKTDLQTETIPNKINAEEIASEEKNFEKINSEENQKPDTKGIKVIQPKKSEIEKKVEKMDAVANVPKEEMKKPVAKENIILSEEDKLINTKVDEVVASVKKIQQNSTELTANEVEKLLNNARRDIQTQRILHNPKIDATALLQNVEWELDKSFRDKVFDALGEGFQKVRTAVSERNN